MAGIKGKTGKYKHKSTQGFQKGNIPMSKGKQYTEEQKEKRRGKTTGDKNGMWKGGLPKCICGKIISYVSKLCVKCATRKGDKNNKWKGGITPINHKIRTSLEMKLWRKACMERDDFTDAKTGQRGGILAVHHINNFADFPELRTSIENGITLSRESHKLFHHIYGNKNNSREQLLEFLTK